MLTNPNTCGLFEREIVEIADAVHEAGGYFYCDGANFNAIAGVARPGDFGIDAMHINLHKTFSTPHGGGGPGSGPVVFSDKLAPFAPVPFVWSDQYDRKIQTVGLVSAEADVDVRIAHGTLDERQFVALFGRNGRLLGALGFNRPRFVMQYRRIIAERGSWDDALALANS